MNFIKIVFYCVTFLLVNCGYHKPEIKVLPRADAIEKRTLFIAFDGVSHDMVESLIKRGYFKDFTNHVPLVVTFPSATTIGFTGIFKPLNVGQVPGYEVRFYSFDEGRIIGGTPKDIYKIHIEYKTFFDAFRFTMFDKSMMYSFPGVAGKQDLMRTRELLYKSPKNVLISYLGGTDGAQHLLGRKRSERFMIFADHFIHKMKEEYERKTNTPLRIVLFSDHGFHFSKLKMVWANDLEKKLKPEGFRITTKLLQPKDVVAVRYGLLSAGVLMTHSPNKEKVARLIHDVEGLDLVFWVDKNKIHILNSLGEEAYFAYQSHKQYAYVPVKGDPLHYLPLLSKQKKTGQMLSSSDWLKLTSESYYPDAGYRLYDAFHDLVKNKASILFSLKEAYQFGSFPALAGTKLKPGGHKGTHGGLFRETSWGILMTDDKGISLPAAVRYDDLFPLFLKPVTDAYKKKVDVYWPKEHSNESHE